MVARRVSLLPTKPRPRRGFSFGALTCPGEQCRLSTEDCQCGGCRCSVASLGRPCGISQIGANQGRPLPARCPIGGLALHCTPLPKTCHLPFLNHKQLPHSNPITHFPRPVITRTLSGLSLPRNSTCRAFLYIYPGDTVGPIGHIGRIGRSGYAAWIAASPVAP